MKFCKDCKHYSPAGAVTFAAWPATCHFKDIRDPVTGSARITGLCESLRETTGECGPDAVWFKPANLDGRLAMIEGEPKCQ